MPTAASGLKLVLASVVPELEPVLPLPEPEVPDQLPEFPEYDAEWANVPPVYE